MKGRCGGSFHAAILSSALFFLVPPSISSFPSFPSYSPC